MKVDGKFPGYLDYNFHEEIESKYRTFEHLTNASNNQRTADEYYWNHQQHLERSDLRFDALKTTSKFDRNREAIKPFHNPELFKIEQHLSIKNRHDIVLMNKMNVFEPTFNSDVPSDCTAANLLLTKATLYPFLTATKIEEEPSLLDKNHPTSSYATLTVHRSDPNDQEQYYHLFIEDKEAELSLKITSVYPKKAGENIKELFKHNGIKLTKLIINGVAQ